MLTLFSIINQENPICTQYIVSKLTISILYPLFVYAYHSLCMPPIPCVSLPFLMCASISEFALFANIRPLQYPAFLCAHPPTQAQITE